MSVPVHEGLVMDNFKKALINVLEALPSPEGCGCAKRKRAMIAKLEGQFNAGVR